MLGDDGVEKSANDAICRYGCSIFSAPREVRHRNIYIFLYTKYSDSSVVS